MPVSCFNKGIELTPNSALAWNNRGYAYQLLEMYEEALYDHNVAISLNDKYSEAYIDKATALLYLGEIEKSRTNKEKGEYLKGMIDYVEIEREKIVIT